MKNATQQLEAIFDLSKAIVGALDVEDVCSRIVKRTSDILGVDKVSIMKLDENDKTLKIIASCGLPKKLAEGVCVKIGQGISGNVFKSSRPVLIKDISAKGGQPNKRYKSRSLMSAPVTCFPLKVKGKPVGVINVTDKKNNRAFTKEDLALLTAIANQTAGYLYLCELAESAKRTEHIRREFELARSIQQSLLPKKAPRLDGVDIAGACVTADKVGGDYFDFLLGGARPPAVVVADISGHSVGAAMTMSAFRNAVRSNTSTSMFSPSIAVERLNTNLYEDLLAAEQFISLVYLQILTSGSARYIKYTTAGHYAPLILKGESFMSHSTDDLLLGIERFEDYHDKKVEMKKGDIVVLYTDGLIEASSASGSRYGIERLRSFIKKNRDRSASELVDGVNRDMSLFLKKMPLRDDATLVVMKF